MIITSLCLIFKTDELKANIVYTEEAVKAMNSIPKDKLILMDNNNIELKTNIIELYQDFE